MRLRAFFKSLLATPLIAPRVIIAGQKPERVMIRTLEMQTCYGTIVLVFILPDGKRLVFVHDRDTMHACSWYKYVGDWRDLDLVPWFHREGQSFPDYRAVEHEVRWRYEKETSK